MKGTFLVVIFIAGICLAQQPVPVSVEGEWVQGTLEGGLAVYRGISFAARQSVTFDGEPLKRWPSGRVCGQPTSSLPDPSRGETVPHNCIVGKEFGTAFQQGSAETFVLGAICFRWLALS
jgi:hypothetical protein